MDHAEPEFPSVRRSAAMELWLSVEASDWLSQVIGRSPILRLILATASCVTLIFGIVDAHAQQKRPAAAAQDKSGRAAVPPTRKASVTPAAATEDEGRARLPGGDNVPVVDDEPLSPELENLLVEWARETAKVKRLQGEHLRREYDLEFETEKLAEGKFYWEAPDKGRIDVNPVQVTQKLIDDRKSGKAKARKKSNGEPFDVQPDKGEKWVCDGLRIYDIDVQKKECSVVQLPPSLQGPSIMDSPLPFLFGMPPEKTKSRFRLKFAKPFNRNDGFAYLTAEPKTQLDAQNWSKAEIILDLKTYFASGVQLTNPAGTRITVYQFSRLERNKGEWFGLPSFLTQKNIFQPDLRDMQVHVIGPDGQVANLEENADAEGEAPKGMVPNVIGMNHQDAVIQLERMGFHRKADEGKQKTILIIPGDPAKKEEDVFTVESQDPKPGTPVKPGMKVKLTLWNKPDVK
jgi:TIGR03009 family protein